MKTHERRRDAGFSLVELMVVIIIIGILGSFAALKLMSKTDDARQAQAIHDIGEIVKAVEFFYLDHTRLPESLEEIADRFKEGEVPLDPHGWWNRVGLQVDRFLETPTCLAQSGHSHVKTPQG